MLRYLKTPKNISEFTLMRGVTDFSNLKQFDAFETGYSFLFVLDTPEFMKNDKADALTKELQKTFVSILEGEFRGLDGIPDISSETGNITNGINELNLINKVTEDTSIQVSMSFYERSGSPITKYLHRYLTGIKDPRTQAKTYHGLIEDGTISNPGPSHEVFTFLYVVTDNTCRRVEKAYLLANAQPTTVPNSTLYNSSKGDIQFQEISIQFNAFPITSDEINLMANRLLFDSLATSSQIASNSLTGKSNKIVLDSNNYKYAIIDDTKKSSAYSNVIDTSNNDNRFNSLYDYQ